MFNVGLLILMFITHMSLHMIEPPPGITKHILVVCQRHISFKINDRLGIIFSTLRCFSAPEIGHRESTVLCELRLKVKHPLTKYQIAADDLGNRVIPFEHKMLVSIEMSMMKLRYPR